MILIQNAHVMPIVGPELPNGCLLALIPIWLYRGRQGYHSKAFQLSCYAFYPVHMLILVLILNYVNSF